MLKNISFLALASVLTLTTACILVDGTDVGDDEVGDGDGDATTTGDGDGDPTTGDGDGDPTTGDGDGDPTTGDGDGDPTTGDGDGDPGPACGWFEDPDQPGYYCGGEGEDPSGTFPSACPAGLVDGDTCETTGLTGAGCCDAEGNNWYCVEDGEGNQFIVFEACGA